MADGVKHWTRAQDISQALDTVLADPDLSDHIDKTRIMAAGFSYGGWTALSLGGIRGNHAGIVEACRTHGAALVYCDRFLSDEIDLPGIDPAPWNASYRDSRITHVAAIDPGFVWGLTEGETADPADNMLIIGLGAGEDRMLATDFDQSSFTTLVPRARIEHLAPAIHFTAMPLCKPAGAAILREENDDPVCTDPAGTDRAACTSGSLTCWPGTSVFETEEGGDAQFASPPRDISTSRWFRSRGSGSRPCPALCPMPR